jgi:hypothetical protein
MPSAASVATLVGVPKSNSIWVARSSNGRHASHESTNAVGKKNSRCQIVATILSVSEQNMAQLPRPLKYHLAHHALTNRTRPTGAQQMHGITCLALHAARRSSGALACHVAPSAAMLPIEASSCTSQRAVKNTRHTTPQHVTMMSWATSAYAL